MLRKTLKTKPDYPALVVESAWRLVPRRLRKWLTEVVHGIARKTAIQELNVPMCAVLEGPLAGTLLTEQGSSWSHQLDTVSTVFGMYESEVNKRIIDVCESGSFETFVHVGCSSGVLAAGLMRSNLFSHAALIDIDPAALRSASANMHLNSVSDFITSQSFSAQYVRGRAVFLIDIEGEELAFFEEHLDALRKHVLFFELHEKGDKQVTQARELLARLGQLYDVEVFGSGTLTGRVGSAFAEHAGHLSDYESFCLVSEGRSHLQRWVRCTPQIT